MLGPARRALWPPPGGQSCASTAGAWSTEIADRSGGQEKVRARLLTEHRIVTTAAGLERAHGDMVQLTTHVDTDAEDGLRLRNALVTLSTAA